MKAAVWRKSDCIFAGSRAASAQADLGHTHNNTVTARLKQQEEQKNFSSPIFFLFYTNTQTVWQCYCY